MDYITIERVIYDAMVSALTDCRDVLEKAVCQVSPGLKQEWIGSGTAQTILQRSRRSMATLRAEGKIGYSMIEGKIYYPSDEIGRMLNRNYMKHERGISPPNEG